ncbi:P-loop containing nucleoside triphosphate hydrolase protein [Phycomyces nitens]|nr:P-loop containing nucleoside triphosphate hydrolase protein [Phycomyces nitens]
MYSRVAHIRLPRSPFYISRSWQFSLELQRTESAIRSPIRSTLFSTKAPTNSLTPTLRKYQQECIDACLNKLSEGVRRQVVSLPVGSGKTVVMANLIPKLPNPTPIATKTLIIAHRVELLEQARAQIQRFNPNLNVVIDQGKRRADLENSDIIVASVQTLAKGDMKRLERYDPAMFKAIIIDEAHHASAPTYVKIMDHFGATQEGSSMFIWGCSATVRRHDGVSLSNSFDEISFHMDLMHMLEMGWLSPMKVTTVETSVDLSKVSTRYDDFLPGELSRAVNTAVRNKIIVQSWQKYAQKDRLATIVFAVDIAHTVDMCNIFRENGIAAEYITSKSSAIERHDIIDRFKNGEFPILVNCGILTEGTDIPRIDCVLMARPTRSSGLFQQMFGRGMRLYPNKKDCLVIDFVDSFERVGKDGLVTVPTLLGLDRNELVENENILNMEKRAIKAEAARLLEEEKGFDNFENENLFSAVSLKVTEYDSIEEIAVDFSGGHELRTASSYSWVAVGDNTCVLSIMNSGSVVLKCDDDGIWTGTFSRELIGKEGNKVRTRPTDISLTADTRFSAIRAADTWIQKKLKGSDSSHLLMSLHHSAKYRNHPATEAQLKILSKSKLFPKREISKGQAMDLISRLKFGQIEVWKKAAYEKAKRKFQADEANKKAALKRVQ